MSDAPALLAAIRAAPDDDAPRLVYADWLDEHAQPERAEFIRVQCALARTADPALRCREAELLAAHHDAIAGPFAAPDVRYVFRRGFITAIGHLGLFVSTRRGRTSDALTHIRFMPNGYIALFVVGSGPEIVAETIQLMEVRGPSPYFATYNLDAVTYPGTIRVLLTYEDTVVDLSGSFEGATFFLARSGNQSRKYYVLHPIPGFSSFPET